MASSLGGRRQSVKFNDGLGADVSIDADENIQHFPQPHPVCERHVLQLRIDQRNVRSHDCQLQASRRAYGNSHSCIEFWPFAVVSLAVRHYIGERANVGIDISCCFGLRGANQQCIRCNEWRQIKATEDVAIRQCCQQRRDRPIQF